MSVRKSSHGTIFLIVSSGSPRALIASSLRSTSKKPFCPMTRSLHPPMTACGHRVRFVATWREEFFEVPICRKQPRARASSPVRSRRPESARFRCVYVDCDHDDRHAEPQTDADRMHDAIGDDFSAIVIPADLPRTYVG